ncbi:MAG: hypothetical protein CMK09_00770 [Ponticaulis sp.]|nr:hypothetical protein [Ponticaulis sp.]
MASPIELGDGNNPVAERRGARSPNDQSRIAGYQAKDRRTDGTIGRLGRIFGDGASRAKA